MKTDGEDRLASAPPEDRRERDAAVERQGFLPIATNWFDRLFIAVVIWIALCLFWFRFVEPLGPSIWIANAIGIALAALLIRKG